MLYYWTDFLTEHMKGGKFGTFKSPLKFIVSPLTKLIIHVDKKKINKISEGKIASSDVDTLIKGGVMKDMDDQIIWWNMFNSIISIIMYILIWFSNIFEKNIIRCW